MWQYRKTLGVLVGLLFWVSTGHAASSKGIVDKIQEHYATLKSFQTEFIQELTYAATREVEVQKGKIYFRHPQFIRLETETPDREMIIVGKELIWHYFPEEKFVNKYNASQLIESKTLLNFLSGQTRLNEDFEVVNQGEDLGWIKLKLIPKKREQGVVLAYLWVDKKNYLLQQILIIDFYGNGNQLTLQNLRLNAPVEDKMFVFTPPAGVQVRDNTAKQ